MNLSRYVLRGRIVTMNRNREVIDDGRLLVKKDGTIAAVLRPADNMPPTFSDAPVLETGGSIYPGLIDLHNHFAFDAMPLWPVPKKYELRETWMGSAAYQHDLVAPMAILKQHGTSAKAIVRYVETKALIGGTTTGQGMLTSNMKGQHWFKGAMRNVEVPDDPDLPRARTLVPNLRKTADGIEEFRTAVETTLSYFYHLAEGGKRARVHYLDLVEHDLIRPSLVGIHALGLTGDDLGALARAGAKIVWSPFSNLLLYGEALDLAAVMASGLQVALGCDWSPTGSKNLLEELKVARWVAARSGAAVSDRALVEMVTTGAAHAIYWHTRVGRLIPDTYADVLIIQGTGADPYAHLIDATEDRISLVIVGGQGRYGDPALMQALHPGEALEDVTVRGADKRLYLGADTELDGLSFDQAQKTLKLAMSDLAGFHKEQAELEGSIAADSPRAAEDFTLVLDNDWAEVEDLVSAGLFADKEPLNSVPLDAPFVAPFVASVAAGSDAEYWQRLTGQVNLPAGLAAALKTAYGG
ncbi:MAG TPA: amidohydrolase family protein [Kofleriaceae bacterium]|nr:amidohydrolase family protein [Kofleriaceae bacterium]